MENKEQISLGKKTLLFYVQLILITPFYFLYVSDTKKTWKEFVNGLITHEHEWKDEPFEVKDWGNSISKCHECKHYGCNIVHHKNYLTQKGAEFYKRFPNLWTKDGYYENESDFIQLNNK
jgi:hypothetical protein